MHQTHPPKSDRIVLVIKGGKHARRTVKQTGAGTHKHRCASRLGTRSARTRQAMAD